MVNKKTDRQGTHRPFTGPIKNGINVVLHHVFRLFFHNSNGVVTYYGFAIATRFYIHTICHHLFVIQLAHCDFHQDFFGDTLNPVYIQVYAYHKKFCLFFCLIFAETKMSLSCYWGEFVYSKIYFGEVSFLDHEYGGSFLFRPRV